MYKLKSKLPAVVLLAVLVSAAGCEQKAKTDAATTADSATTAKPKFLNEPLIKEIFTADPSAHVFNGKIYIYPSHDIDAGIPNNDNGDQYAMEDYRVLSMDSIGGKVTDNGVALSVKDVPWASKQMWAPDAAFKNGTYYLYFPVRDKQGAFRIGVATSKSPTGPFKAEPKPIEGAYSIDPAVFTDDDGTSYMYFGGIWGGQLQKWATGKYDANGSTSDLKKDDEPALSAKVAKLSKDMLSFDGKAEDVVIVDKDGKQLLGKDHDRRFFEGAYMHKFNGKYYFTYSTGDTHFLAYAIGDKPTGKFVYQGNFLKPVQGWTTHHSIIQFKGKWYLFYHDTQISGENHLRNVKVTELDHKADGSLGLIDPFVK